jgi:regulator of protease activity HflC (stomatin/prohibitin superfamily)
MNNRIITIGAVAALVIASGFAVTSCTKVPAGNVGVKVYLLGGDKGDVEVLSPGRYWVGWNENLFLFPTFTQTATWAGPVVNDQGTAEKEDDTWTPDERVVFQDKDGLKVLGGVSMTYSIDKAKAGLLFQKYRRGINEITDPYLKNMVRGALVAEGSKVPVDQIYGPGKEELMQRVEARVRKQVEPYGLRIERLEWTGDLGLPSPVRDALNAKIATTQMAAQRENQLRQAEAEAAIAKAQAEGVANAAIEEAKGEAEAKRLRADAEAEANRKIAASVTPALIDYTKAKNWDGVMPKVTGGATPMIDLRGQ